MTIDTGSQLDYDCQANRNLFTLNIDMTPTGHQIRQMDVGSDIELYLVYSISVDASLTVAQKS